MAGFLLPIRGQFTDNNPESNGGMKPDSAFDKRSKGLHARQLARHTETRSKLIAMDRLWLKSQRDVCSKRSNRMNFVGRILLTATAVLLLGAPGFAQSNVAEPDQSYTADRSQQAIDVFQTAGRDQYGSQVFQTSDPRFMHEAAQDAMTKINFARLALQNAQNEQVRSFAEQILRDYGKAQRDLFNIAYQQIVRLPDTLDPQQLDTFNTLSQLHGAAFDQAYMKAMLNDDQTATSRFKQEATKGDHWASHTLPTLESNLKEAQKVARVVGVHSTATNDEQRTPSAGKAVNTVSQEP